MMLQYDDSTSDQEFSLRLRILAAIAVAVALSLTARADSYQYDFTGIYAAKYGDPNDSFRYQSSTLFTTDTSFTAACGIASACNVDYNVASGQIEIDEPGSIYDYHFNLPASFFTLGTHVANGNTLSITQAATPEPSSLALLGTGVLGMIGVARRRFART